MYDFNRMIRLKEARWNNATESERWHILEERELSRKIAVLKSFVPYDIHTGAYTAKLFQGEFTSRNKRAAYEWALEAHFGIKVKLIKMDLGVRFSILPGSAPIIDESHRREKRILADPRIGALKDAQAKLRKHNPSEAEKLQVTIDAITKTIE